MKKEYTFVFILGLFILGYVLDMAVKPLNLSLTSPYQFFQNQYITHYPFTAASVLIKVIGIFLGTLWILSFVDKQYFLKGAILLVGGALMQLYALQDIVSKSKAVPIEWSLSISLAGALFLIPTILFLVRGIFASMHKQLAGESHDPWEEKKETSSEDKEG